MEQLETKANNHVRSMKSKFELNSSRQTLPSSLSRQLSDPVKVKRTPAFRNNDKPFQRGRPTSYREKKSPTGEVKKLKHCFDSNKLLYERSNSSAEIILNRNNKKKEHEYANITDLYTKAFPKSLRDPIHCMSTMKIDDKKTENNNSIINSKLDALNDTLKLALSRPLPKGPAPQKPPRTFAHDNNNVGNLFLRSKTDLAGSSRDPRPDTKYMLDRLEQALKKNNQRVKKHNQPVLSKITKSDSPKGRMQLNCLNWSNKVYDKLDDSPVKENGTHSSGKANKGAKKEEPIYAEPFVVLKSQSIDIINNNPLNNNQNQLANGQKSTANRNSLYYMSTIVPSTHANDKNHECFNPLINPDKPHADSIIRTSATNQEKNSAQNGNPLDALTEELKLENPRKQCSKIQSLIKSFEEQRIQNADRVEVLERQLRQTLEQSFNNDSGVSSGDNNTNAPLSEPNEVKFETYVRSIRMISKCSTKVESQKQNLFHCCLLVGLAGNSPYIKFKYPPEVYLPAKIEDLCFPDASSGVNVDLSPHAQNYSLVLTNNEGERIFGYCRRVLPEDSKFCLPLAYCILSKNRAPRFYKEILEEIESRHGISDKLRDDLLSQFYNYTFPLPGQSIQIHFNTRLSVHRGHYATVNSAPRLQENDTIVFTLHQESRHVENDLQELYSTLHENILLKVFASLILERKVIFVSSVLGRLSACIEALQNILYPFSWHHTLIPVVPKELWEIVEAPTPVICGALSLSIINNFTVDNGIVIDLDEGEVLTEMGDESTIIPKCLGKEFRDGINLANSSEGPDNLFLSDAFLRIFVHSCGHYKEYIVDSSEEEASHKKKFNTSEFVQAAKKKSTRRFLKWFTQTTMFLSFIDTVLADPNAFKIFDSRIQIYGAHGVSSVLEKMKDWNHLHSKPDKNQL